MSRGYHAGDHMFFVLDPEREKIIDDYNGHLKVYHSRKNADRYAGHYGEIIEYAPIKYGRNVTQMNPVDEFICSECGFTTRDMGGYDAEDDVCYEFCPHFCPNCGAAILKDGEA
jgi:hypothetical protein